MRNTGQDRIRRIRIPLPPIHELKQAVEVVERQIYSVDQIDGIIERKLKQSEKLRQSILKQAFEGKLVPQDSNDEPASVLLDRLKAEKA